ncbi:MAG TPA: hypothetical protein V6C63_15325, partial [Allocoleopsis sp.]
MPFVTALGFYESFCFYCFYLILLLSLDAGLHFSRQTKNVTLWLRWTQSVRCGAHKPQHIVVFYCFCRLSVTFCGTIPPKVTADGRNQSSPD